MTDFPTDFDGRSSGPIPGRSDGSSSKSLVLDLLTYIEHAEKLKTKPLFSIPRESFCAFQHELAALPEVRFNLQGENDEIWLRIPRLREIPPPKMESGLTAWVTLPKSPAKVPELRTQIPLLQGYSEKGVSKLEEHPEIRERFDWYITNHWNPWSAAEQPRREAIARYNQLFSLQQAISSEGADSSLEVVWGIGYAIWKKEGYGSVLSYPLIVQSCDVTLNEQNFDLEVRPRNVEPHLESDAYAEMDIPGVRPLEAFWKAFLANGAGRVSPFEDASFDGALKAAVGHLDQNGNYKALASHVPPPAPSEHLSITNGWVIFARKRSSGIFLEDINRLKERIKTVEALPAVIRSFVEIGDDEIRPLKHRSFRGLSSSHGPEDAFELYFPMAYNEEQVSIVQKLEHGDGVVVQGPPGTGKTHTIANILCHYLAQGKRVLVTSKGGSALLEIIGKLPERIRPLSVALLSDDREGLKHFEHSIQTISSNVSGFNPADSALKIASLEEQLKHLHAAISHVDQATKELAQSHNRTYQFQGEDLSAEEIAKLVLEQTKEHGWMDDDLPAAECEAVIPVTEDAIEALRQARSIVGMKLSYLGCVLPTSDALPSWPEIKKWNEQLMRAHAIEEGLADGTLLSFADTGVEMLEKAKHLMHFLEKREKLKETLSGYEDPFPVSVAKRLGETEPSSQVLDTLLGCCRDIERLEEWRQRFIAKAVEIPEDAELNADFREAIDRLTSGKKAFAAPFGKGEARRLVSIVTIQGRPPQGKSDWDLIEKATVWRDDCRKVQARWSSIAREFGIPLETPASKKGFDRLFEQQRQVRDLHKLCFEYDKKLHGEIEGAVGKQIADRIRTDREASIATIKASLHAHLEREELAHSVECVTELTRKLSQYTGEIVAPIRSFLSDFIGKREVAETEIKGALHNFRSELDFLAELRPAFASIAETTAAIEAAGASRWARRLRLEPAVAQPDPAIPFKWREAWNWRNAAIFLERIDGHAKMRELFAKRSNLATNLAKTYQDLVAEKTWLGVFNNSPPSIRQALQSYLTSVQAMGHGTGVRAVRYRRDAREAMTRAYRAVPCWILPEWRISETIPSEIGLFDLVIIDEASQSDIWAFPALMRGKKLLVVGDHKQVSPSAIGVPEEKIKELSARFLQLQPHGAQMTPERSIYDLARVVFAGSSVMLKEHFRSVPAIIEFSNREFYSGDIKPLRLPSAHERLDPPLIDVFVKGGFRDGDVNPVEAKAIVDEIDDILRDKSLSGRSIGVVTLLGQAQSAHIQELIAQRISPEDVVARSIAVGPPPVFQGRERDIMLISMVLAPGSRAAQDRADQHQRFNVALSRARDRMYLFRSIDHGIFGEDTLNSKLMRHFKEPFRHDAKTTQLLRERCESGFEREMFDELIRRGYRLQPQVRSGGYRIDFVIEGREGRRLAVECDGDRFHGPDQWSDDMARQRVLERAGWTFWRCFASSFVRRRDAVMLDLVKTLDGLGIEPLGSEEIDHTVWVHTKSVDPMAVELSLNAVETLGEPV